MMHRYNNEELINHLFSTFNGMIHRYNNKMRLSNAVKWKRGASQVLFTLA